MEELPEQCESTRETCDVYLIRATSVCETLLRSHSTARESDQLPQLQGEKSLKKENLQKSFLSTWHQEFPTRHPGADKGKYLLLGDPFPTAAQSQERTR